MRFRTHAEEEMWRCDACGAFTLEPLQVCSECQAKRLETPTTAKRKTKARSKARKTESRITGSKRKSKSQKEESPEADKIIESLVDEKPVPADPNIQSKEPIPPELPSPLELVESQDELPQERASTESDDQPLEKNAELFEPIEPLQASEEEAQPVLEEPARGTLSAQSVAGVELGDRLGLVYVNTPVPELIKRKIEVDFEAFPTISIGRSPENVIVIPDGGVSRIHAELRKEGDRVLLTDLGSSNGSYLYDGKEFRRVAGSVALGRNSLVKLGTGTILRLVAD